MWCWFVQLLGCPGVSLSRRSSYFVVRLQSCWVVLLTNCLMLDEQFNEIYLGSNIFIRNVESCEYLQFCLLVFLSLYISLFFLVSCLLALCICALVSSRNMRFCLTSCSCLYKTSLSHQLHDMLSNLKTILTTCRLVC